VRIERHIFGSVDGYRTLAHSPGLSPADCNALEAFAFGTPYDPAVRASFSARPAYWSRPLAPQRRALTLVRLGDADDAGRPTLLFLTAVVSREDWDDVLYGDVTPLLRHKPMWNWKSGAPITSIDFPGPDSTSHELSTSQTQTALGILSLVEATWGTGKPVVISEDQCSIGEIAAVERLLPPDIRDRFSVVYRALNTEMRASLICLADGVPASLTNPPRPLRGAASPYAKRLVQAGILEGRDTGRVIRTYNRFAHTDIEHADDDLEESNMRSANDEPPARRTGHVAVLLSVAIAALAAGGATGWYLHRPPPPPANPWPAVLVRFLQAPLASAAEQASALQSLSDDFTSNIATVPPDISEQLRAAVADRTEDVRLFQAADAAIAAARAENKSTIDAADQSVRALEARAQSVAGVLSRYWAEHRASLSPRPDRLARLMTEIYAEIGSLCAATRRPASPESEADRAAEARSLMAAVTVNARIDPSLRDAKFDEAITALTAFVKRMNAARPAQKSGGAPGPDERAALREIDRQLARVASALTTPQATQPGGPQNRAVSEACRDLARACNVLQNYRGFEMPLNLLAEAIESGRAPTTTAPFGTITVDITLWPVLERCATATTAMRRSPRPKDAQPRFDAAIRDLRRIANEKLPPSGPSR